MNGRRTPRISFSSLGPWCSEIIFKAEKKNWVTTENRFKSLLGCKMGTETEPHIEKESKETFEKRHLWYWVDKGSMAIHVHAELKLPKNRRWISRETQGRREKLFRSKWAFENKWLRVSQGEVSYLVNMVARGRQRENSGDGRGRHAPRGWALKTAGLCLLGRRCRHTWVQGRWHWRGQEVRSLFTELSECHRGRAGLASDAWWWWCVYLCVCMCVCGGVMSTRGLCGAHTWIRLGFSETMGQNSLGN